MSQARNTLLYVIKRVERVYFIAQSMFAGLSVNIGEIFLNLFNEIRINRANKMNAAPVSVGNNTGEESEGEEMVNCTAWVIEEEQKRKENMECLGLMILILGLGIFLLVNGAILQVKALAMKTCKNPLIPTVIMFIALYIPDAIEDLSTDGCITKYGIHGWGYVSMIMASLIFCTKYYDDWLQYQVVTRIQDKGNPALTEDLSKEDLDQKQFLAITIQSGNVHKF